jgi:hypothetical protein
LGPLRIGFFYGVIAVVVALAADLRFLFLDPQTVPDWILAAIEEFRTQLVLTTILFFGILAAMRTQPTRAEPGVPYRSLLLRDCVLAATVVAVMAGLTLFAATALNATVFADEIRAYASDATPSIVAYNEKVAGRLQNPPPLPPASEIETGLQPPVLRDLGRSLANIVLRALLVGTAGAVVGLIRGRLGTPGDPKPR